MPLLIITGLPSSGKTVFCQKCIDYFTKHHPDVSIFKVTDDDFDKKFDKNSVYADSTKEKQLRSSIKSKCTRHLGQTSSLIMIDSLNYIKGFRYELYCASKAAQVSQATVFCCIGSDQARIWNSGRPKQEQYSSEIFDCLTNQYEEPNSQNRWDSPLFAVTATMPDTELPFNEIYECLFLIKPPPPNKSTLGQPVAKSENLVSRIDSISHSIIKDILEQQKCAVAGDHLTVQGSTEKIKFQRIISLPELNRIRRQFLNYSRTNPCVDEDKIATLFVQFLNNSSVK